MLRLSDVGMEKWLKFVAFITRSISLSSKIIGDGLTPNTEFQVIRRATFGDPSKFACAILFESSSRRNCAT